MYGDLNRVTLIGNVTREPELRFTPKGSSVLTFGLATNHRIKQDEEWIEFTDFHNIVI